MDFLEMFNGYNWQGRILDVRIDNQDPTGVVTLENANRQMHQQQQEQQAKQQAQQHQQHQQQMMWNGGMISNMGISPGISPYANPFLLDGTMNGMNPMGGGVFEQNGSAILHHQVQHHQHPHANQSQNYHHTNEINSISTNLLEEPSRVSRPSSSSGVIGHTSSNSPSPQPPSSTIPTSTSSSQSQQQPTSMPPPKSLSSKRGIPPSLGPLPPPLFSNSSGTNVIPPSPGGIMGQMGLMPAVGVGVINGQMGYQGRIGMSMPVSPVLVPVGGNVTPNVSFKGLAR
jgi:hypothetical protein